MKNKKIIFFDGFCNFCNRTVDFIWRHNGARNLYYSSLQSEFAKEYLSKRGISDIDLRTIYFIDGQNIYMKSRAIFRILKNLDGVYPILAILALVIPRSISDYFYDVVARYRHKIWGRRDTCRVPNEEEREYFLEQD